MSLQDKAAKLLHDAREILAAATKDERGLTQDEAAKHAAIMDDFDAIQATIRAAKRVESADVPAVSVESREVRREAAVAQPKALGIDSDEYREAFTGYLKRGETRDLKVGTTTSGGYLVPTQFERTLVQALESENIVRGLATVFASEGGTLYIPTVSTHGSAAYIAEEGTYSTSDETFGQVSMSAYKLSTAIKVTEELLADSAFDLDSYLAKEFGRRFGAAEETAFFTGGGSASNQPSGLLANATVGFTTAGTNAITALDIVELYHSLSRPYRSNAVFIAADSTIKAVRKLVDSNGTFIWQPGLTQGEPDRIMGRPVYSSSNVETLATGKKVMVFGDLRRGFWVRDVGGTSVSRLVELYAMNGHVAFRGYRRNDGKIVDSTAIRLMKTA